MTGARPGGAGKTTVMGAFFNFEPAEVPLVAADRMARMEEGLGGKMPRSSFICHEIGNGPYYAYLWGEPLRRYFELTAWGHMLATSLHADTIGEACDQICRVSGAPLERFFHQRHFAFFLAWDRATGRRQILLWWKSQMVGRPTAE